MGCPVWIPEHSGNFPKQEKLGQIYQSGEERYCIRDIITAIKQAKDTVMLISFLLAETKLEQALLQAAQRGVKVYILTASENKLETQPDDDDEFGKKVLKQHKIMLNTLAGHVLLRSAPNFHAKLVLLDVKEPTAQGFLLTANLTTDALERNEELAVRLNPEEAIIAYNYLRWAFWEVAEHELQEKGRLAAINPLGKVTNPQVDGSFFATKPDNTLQLQVEKIIQNADKFLTISSFGWESDFSLVKLLLEKIKNGLQVTVLGRIRLKAMPALFDLAKAGATVLGFRWLHAKAIWNDQREAIVMSANFEKQSFEHSLEFGLYLQNDRADSLGQILSSWKQYAPYRLLYDPKLGDLPVDEVIFWKKGEFNKDKIKKFMNQTLDNVIAKSADNLESIMPNDKENLDKTILAYELVYRWQVVAPRLKGKHYEIKYTIEETLQKEETFVIKDKDGKPIKDKNGKPKKEKRMIDKKVKKQVYYQPPVHQMDNHKVVVIGNIAELASAQKLIEQGIAETIVVRGS
ncbi:phospholipase D-like domain-containing protein [Candidatus Venteria ishoeyi]|uniref:phospholipase D-like domain-containing protein n=1 Tax=Candidatus Venteria ishoeyi TaxID=1899563 RepID=UPI0025A5BBFB|nr:phospholipase D-like domain-containing protein [Candidatus Venteria ishoeyi]MDM8548339.1 phospholipase D-like domain-containing protein [Candidatus Venteria ishoeyi]